MNQRTKVMNNTTIKNKINKIKFTVYYCLALFIGLNSLFMANEQCITRWFKKKTPQMQMWT